MLRRHVRLRARLAAAEAENAELRKRVSEQHLVMVVESQEIVELRKLCGRAAESTQNHIDAVEGITPDVEAELSALRSELEAAARRAGK